MDRRTLIAVVALLAAVTVAGCTDGGNTYGGDSSPSDTQDTQPSNQQDTQSTNQQDSDGAAVEVVSGASTDTTVDMASTQFQSSPQVSKGTVVKFVNKDSYPHTVTINGEGIDKQVSGGSSVTLKFNEASSYNVVCTLHSGMETTVDISG